MDVNIEKTRLSAARMAAEYVASEVSRNPQLRIGLPAGRTMEPVYAELVAFHFEHNLDFSGVKVFLATDYLGLPADSKLSHRYFLDKHLFEQANFRKNQVYQPSPEADDPVRACAEFENKIEAEGGLDMLLLGLGSNGHIGYNEPTGSLFSRTGVRVLSRATVMACAPLFGDRSKVPAYAYSIGLATVLEARHCLLIATGDGKADICGKVVEGPVCALVPGSVLQLHPRCTVIFDQQSAVKLEQRDYYRWVQERKPDFDRVVWPPPVR